MEQHPFEDLNQAHVSQRPTGSSADSPNPQKRARRYGEELKGLVSSDDEGSPREDSTPTFKRRKMGHNTGADSSIGSDSEGLDDGEIIESPLPSHVAQPFTNEAPPQIDLRPQTSTTLNAPTSVSSEDGEIDELLGAEEGSEQTDEIDEQGEYRRTQEPKNTPPVVTQQTSLPGWNHGIQLGTRTTFGTKPANAFFEISPATVEATEETQEQQTKKEKKRVRSRDPVSSFEASNASWNFPLSAREIIVPANTSEEDNFWVALLKDWIARLVQVNVETVDRLTYKVVRSGWALYFTRRMGFLQGTKKHISAIRIVAQSFMASLSKDSIDAMISDAGQEHPADQPDDIIVADSLPPSHDEEFRLQTKYFPGADDPSLRCLSCSGIGHTTQTCPELGCRFCESKSHSSFGCPTRRRCDKCRQIGHSVETCQEKLRLATEELDGCAFCGADHQDQDCFEIWKSFKPSELHIKKVKSIPAFCYVCGGEGHYGPECSLSDKRDKATERATWSKATRDLYVNPESEDVAIAWADIDPSQLTRGEFHVPGRATRKIHTYFVSSDESEEDLIHAPVKKPQARGEIRIASNIGTVNGNSRGRGQPPLPPGPPPPLVENRSRKPFQSAPPGILPPRPQSFGHSRPSGRGRGGSRGRGRGRGRGRA
ncbi:hypothetical protein F4782DRAFT_531211 [Xylaria castorea]|nr:hypothetical protein F4782DRAFT_531211 [Xylaria castorea]